MVFAITKCRKYRRLLITLSLICVSVSSCRRSSHSTSTSSVTTLPSSNVAAGPLMPTIDEAVQIVKDAPTWVLSANCKPDAKILVASIRKLEGLHTESLRKVVVAVVHDAKKENGAVDFNLLAKLFFFNRILFRAPQSISIKDRRSYGGWVGVPVNDGMENLQWPLSVSPTGEVEVIDCFVGYRGEPFDALGEFDFFRDSFGRRP